MFLVDVVKGLAGVGVVEATSLADGVLRVAVFARFGQQEPRVALPGTWPERVTFLGRRTD